MTTEHHHFIKALPVANPSPLWKEEEVLIFLHIPKTGGTTLDGIFSCVATYNEQKYHRFPITDYNPPVLITPGWVGAWNAIVNTKASLKSSVNSVAAHAPFGMHELFDRPCRYLSVIREPVAREISSYNFHYTNFLEKQSSLLELIKNRQLVDNPQTRMLCGKDYMKGDSSQEWLDVVKQNVKKYYALLGVTDCIPELLQTIITCNGWPNLIYPDVKITRDKKIERPSDELLETITTYHYLDVQLYEFAKMQFDRNFSALVDRQKLELESSLVESRPTIVIPEDLAERGEAKVLAHKEAIDFYLNHK